MPFAPSGFSFSQKSANIKRFSSWNPTRRDTHPPGLGILTSGQRPYRALTRPVLSDIEKKQKRSVGSVPKALVTSSTARSP